MKTKSLFSIMKNINAYIHHSPQPMPDELWVSGVTQDHRHVQSGDIFVAIKGEKYDGHDFIEDAILKGAACVIAHQDNKSSSAIPFFIHKEPRLALAELAGKFYAPHPPHIAAVTGTDGKTSVVDFARQLLQQVGLPSASIGTLGLAIKDNYDTQATHAMTTPDGVIVSQLLAQLYEKNIHHVALEASSHGLAEYRLDGIAIKAVALTNISRDHLDYHSSIENYRRAKERLFNDVMLEDGIMVINGDDEWGTHLARHYHQSGKSIIRYGTQSDADIRILCHRPTKSGMEGGLSYEGKTYVCSIPIHGDFQWHNIAAAVGLCMGLGVDADDVMAQLHHLKAVRGRLQPIANRRIYVDYAHTPHALQVALQNLRHAHGKLHVLFGCGGERDKGKRALMGKIADEFADKIIITDDNPRYEPPHLIREDILRGIKNKAKAIIVEERSSAIFQAIQEMEHNDTLLIAGKGHETYQLIGDQVHDCDDAQWARLALQEQIS